MMEDKLVKYSAVSFLIGALITFVIMLGLDYKKTENVPSATIKKVDSLTTNVIVSNDSIINKITRKDGTNIKIYNTVNNFITIRKPDSLAKSVFRLTEDWKCDSLANR